MADRESRMPSLCIHRQIAHRQPHSIRIKIGHARTVSLNSIALAALHKLQGGNGRPGTEPVFPSARTGDALQGRADGFRLLSKRPRFTNIPGIATAIHLPVDLLWPAWICGRSQNCSDVGRRKWSCATRISLRNTRRRSYGPWRGTRGH